MSKLPSANSARRFRDATRSLTAAILLAASGLPAMAKSDHKTVSPREFRAMSASQVPERCVPANGAQIMGGFAGPDDRLDSVTGEICVR
ncbi:hypothetical protein [uncultured Rhodoblastus sp.]|uniref:hypothetical protein n=1 Tax=uncultured Rhodoblastus sp. TaxID=543037 RepID=UPI0025D079BE|nr:hypothetical protein [uncultured Rhodoblastus sp.]